MEFSWADRESVNQRTRSGGDPALAIFEILNQWLNTMTGRNPGHQPPLPVFLSAEREALDYFTDAFRRAGLPARFARGTTNHPLVDPIGDALAYVRDRKNGAA